MTLEEKRSEVVRYWFEKAEDSIISARREFEAGSLTFAMNRLYYCAFYAVSADDNDMDLDRKMIAVIAKANNDEGFNIIRTIFYAYAEVEDVDLVHLPNCWLNIEKYDLDNSFDFSLLQVHQNLLHGLEDIGNYPHDLAHFSSPL